MPSRRAFLASLPLIGLAPLAWSGAGPGRWRPLRILVLGGTNYVGPHLVSTALERGHEVTLFNRGITDGFWGVGFITPLRGWAAADGGVVLETMDGGATWEQRDWAEDQTINRFRMLGEDLGFAIGRRMFRFDAASEGG